MRVFNASITVDTEEGTEVADITKPVRDVIQDLPVTTGIALVNTLHTTCALFVNEFQGALVDDLKALVTRLGHADAHLGNALLGRSIALGVRDGELVLGRFQSIIFAELDGPRQRELAVQVIGE